MTNRLPDEGLASEAASAAVPPGIRSLLVCPKCRGSLVDAERGASLECTSCALAYPVRDGIPIMLVDEAVHRRG